jgi:outer membrane lipoprotein
MLAAASCTVISQQVRSEAESPAVPFRDLIEAANTYYGRTVILGGYILETRNLESETVLKILQVPLQFGEEPATKDRSQGRFIVYYKGFLDPEVYKKDRVITVAGIVIGTVVEKIGDNRIQYLEIENREIYLWPDYKRPPPFFYHRRYPYYRHYDPFYGYPYWY